MKIQLKIIGDALHFSLDQALKTDLAVAARVAGRDEVEWQVSNVKKEFTTSDWICQQTAPSVLIIDGDDATLLRTFQGSQGALQHLVNTSRQSAAVRSPVILVFSSASVMMQWPHLPDFVTDWMLLSSIREEVVPRILGVLRKVNIFPFSQHHAALSLIPATRTMVYENSSARLTPAEYTLLELFLSNIGSIISLQELVQTFRASGKSAEANNIRVAIYQLRLKLDTLTKSQMPLTSIYRQGYCLRQKLKSKPMHMSISGISSRFGVQNSA